MKPQKLDIEKLKLKKLNFPKLTFKKGYLLPFAVFAGVFLLYCVIRQFFPPLYRITVFFLLPGAASVALHYLIYAGRGRYFLYLGLLLAGAAFYPLMFTGVISSITGKIFPVYLIAVGLWMISGYKPIINLITALKERFMKKRRCFSMPTGSSGF